jgi:hypothetical protein
MYVNMWATQPFTQPPALYGWEMTYICETSE